LPRSDAQGVELPAIAGDKAAQVLRGAIDLVTDITPA